MALPRFRPPPPRQKPYVDTLGRALKRASALTPAEIADTMAPAQECEKRLREGVATQDQLIVLRTQLRIAMGIEHSRIVRGLREHLATALAALDAIEARALKSGVWRPSALYYHELDAIHTAVHLHEFQLQQVSAGELHGITKKLIAQTQSSGGAFERRSLADMGLEQTI